MIKIKMYHSKLQYNLSNHKNSLMNEIRETIPIEIRLKNDKYRNCSVKTSGIIIIKKTKNKTINGIFEWFLN